MFKRLKKLLADLILHYNSSIKNFNPAQINICFLYNQISLSCVLNFTVKLDTHKTHAFILSY